MRLSLAQIQTLYRMEDSTSYMLRGDCKKAYEKRPSLFHDVNAPSIPVLFRLGLVDWKVPGEKDPTRYSSVVMTKKGRAALKEIKENMAGGKYYDIKS
ncbi:TPA: hypothetical protein NPY75_003192 [Escherichia coli]|nr:hypothetical protein [Escherichia coli]